MAKPKPMIRRKAMLTRADLDNAPGLRWRLEQTEEKTMNDRIRSVVAWLWRTEIITDPAELKALGYELIYDESGERLQESAE